jgi:hypothetical protein
MQPNLIATLALVGWPFVALVLFMTRPLRQALLWNFFGAFLLLPAGFGFKFAMIPELGKSSIPVLCALLFCLLFGKRLPKIANGLGFPELLVAVFVFEPFITAQLNPDPVFVADRVLAGGDLYDAGSAAVAQVMALLPFFIGRQFLRDGSSNREILRVLAIGLLCYSPLMLFEVRMSPQLSNWIYGYSASDFIQQVRGDSYRPVVFVGHGLTMAFLAMTGFVAATALWKAKEKIFQYSAGAATAYLGVLLVLCRSLASLTYGVASFALIRFVSPKMQMRAAMILVTFALCYPLLRSADLIPVETILDIAGSVNADRADSLQTRFDNEQQLLSRASQRFFFGWGRWGRSRIYDEYGNDRSVTDGRWIITMGQFGLIGFLAEFGLLSITVFRAAFALRFARSKSEEIFLAALALIVAVSIFDLVPNSGLSSWTWLLAGSLLGRAEFLRVASRRSGSVATQPSNTYSVANSGIK